MKVYYNSDANIDCLFGSKIAIIGYGIQGRAQALNLRDSGCDIIIGNIQDRYYHQAKLDGFEVTNIKKACAVASIILLLIPDEAHGTVYKQDIVSNLKKDILLVFAHGYSIYTKEIVPTSNFDICLLAPRMPGKQIREYFLNNGGVPAFISIYQNASGKAREKVLALAKAMGFTKAGVMEVSFKVETELDLFVEQFFLPILIRSIRLSFDILTEEGFPPEATLMELYASGEIGELMMMASKIGIYRVWKENASPTCQFGILRNSKLVLPEDTTRELIKHVLKDIRSGRFQKDLANEAQKNYSSLQEYNKNNENSLITKTQDKLMKIIKYRPTEK